MNVLHVTFHQGCKINLDYVAQSLGFNLTTQRADWNYNIGSNRANEIWNKYKDYYNSFDAIVTSDTAPLSRIFLQNNYSKKLIVWVCNRFDYCDMSTNDCAFPDQSYYQLIRDSINKNNVKFFSYTKFEHEYAQKYRGINWGNETIKPCAFYDDTPPVNFALSGIDKESTFFIPPYHNDTIFMNLKSKCDQLGIRAYAGRYNGPLDLMNIKGIIHIPYAWSNLALFENWSMGNVYFVPSKDFLINLAHQNNFFWSPPFPLDHIESSEWYLPEHKDLFIYFNDWNHLKTLSNDNDLINSKKTKVLNYSKIHTNEMLNKWKKALDL
jgi:hypothetical protein